MLVVLGSGAVLVVTFVAGIVVGAVVTGSDRAASSQAGSQAGPVQAPDPPASDRTASAPRDEPAGDLDPCLVGTWEVTSHSESYDTDQGPARITDLTRTVTISPDGTETVSYDGDTATVSAPQGTVPARFDGEVVYRVTTSGSTLSFDLVSSDATITLTGPEGEESEDLEPGIGDVTYTCTDSQFRQQADGFESVMERVS